MAILGAFAVPHPPIIMKEIGGDDIKRADSTIKSYEKVAEEIAALKPETIIITSPHSIMYGDYFHISPGTSAKGSMARFGRPEISFEVEYDEELVKELSDEAENIDFPAGTLGEKNPELDHGTMVPLYFINQKYNDYKLVRIGLSGLTLKEHYKLGMMIKDAIDKLDRRVVFIASGDLSHKLLKDGPYGLTPEGLEYDRRIMEVLGKGEFDKLFEFDENFLDKAAECGHRSFCIMAGALDGTDVESTELSHEGPFGVGYGICTFKIKDNSKKNPEREFLKVMREKRIRKLDEIKSNEDAYISLARATIDSYINDGIRPDIPENLPEEMLNERAGVSNAIAASTRDPRFSPIKPDELDYLDINVDVLAEPEDISSKDELDVKRYGVIVRKDGKQGLLLPNLDGVDSVDEQVSIALQKAGLSPYCEGYEMQRFEVIRHEVK